MQERRSDRVLVSSVLFIWHSQITITLHPKVDNEISANLSLYDVPFIFSNHHSSRVFGNTKYLQSSCPCQKQPFTNMTVLYLGNTISGFPGNFLSCKRYLNPLANKNLLTSISGLVFFPLILLIL